MIEPVVTPRGVCNNNPGNIRHSDSFQWVGQVGVDSKGFCIFSNPLRGIRAMADLLRNYTTRDGCGSIAAIIERYAPPEANDTDSYIHNVCTLAQLLPSQLPMDTDEWCRLINSMIVEEQGRNWYTYQMVLAGYFMLLQEEDKPA